MKLNLIPKVVDTAAKAKRALFGSLLLFAVSCVAAFFLATISIDRVKRATQAVDEAKPLYDNAVAVATEADAMMTKPQVREVVVNASLAEAMNKANSLYPDVYDFVKPYIPAFFRITRLAASPVDATTSTVSMTGTVKNAQEYANLMLALLRIPGATSVSRSGFSAEDMVVPALTLVDQYGRPRKLADAPVPDDEIDRLAYFENQQTPSGYLQTGNFGITEPGTTKEAGKGESLITVSVTIPRNLQVPNPRATITTLGGTAAPGVPAGGAPAAPATGRGAGDDL